MPRLFHKSYQKKYTLTVIKEIVRFDNEGEEIDTDYTDIVDNEVYTDLSEIVRDIKSFYCYYWSEDPPWEFSSLRSFGEEDYESGNKESYSVFIQRGDVGDHNGLTFQDIRYIHNKLKLYGRLPEKPEVSSLWQELKANWKGGE